MSCSRRAGARRSAICGNFFKAQFVYNLESEIEPSRSIFNQRSFVVRITSKAFTDGDKIPDKYAMDTGNHSPPVHFDEVPDRAKSLALIVEDPDATQGTFNHWLLFNMDPKIHDIKEDSVPVMATQGRNDFGEIEYDGPKPPSGEHRYRFKIFALDTVLALPDGCSRDAIDREMKGHVLESATLTGKYAH